MHRICKEKTEHKIGSSVVKAESSAKLLGMSLDSNQKWNTQIKLYTKYLTFSSPFMHFLYCIVLFFTLSSHTSRSTYDE